MELIYNTTELLGITDRNIKITFYYKRPECIVVNATLDYTPSACPHCKGKMIKYDFQKPSKIPLLECQGMPTALYLKKRRFQCKECRKVQVSETPIVKKNHQISTDIQRKITQLLIEKDSMKSIAERLHISTSTVLRRLKLVKTKPNLKSLPKIMSWDEYSFKKGKMSFIAQDFESSEIVAILDGRTHATIRDHFQQYTLKVRKKVEIITMDMFTPYFKLVKQLFPKAKIVLDRFHIVQHLSRAMNRVRIQIMNQFDKQSKEYRRLKRYWKIIQTDSRKLSTKRPYQPMFQMHLTSQEILDELLGYSEELNQHYQLYQMLLFHIKNKNTDHFFALIEEEIGSVNPIFQTVFHTFLKNKDKVCNALELPYSNARLEATNNLIKVIKRNAFGFRNFDNFKKRIFLALNTKRDREQVVLSRLAL